METASVSGFKTSLSAYLRLVQKGEEVLITDHGRPVAKVLPVSPTETLPEHLQEMIRDGLARPGSGVLPKNFWDLPRPKVSKGTLRDIMSEERGDVR